MSETQATIVEFLRQTVVSKADQVALRVKRDGQYQPLTWRQLAGDVVRLSKWIVDQGVAAGDRVIQVSENRYEWIVLDLAIQFAEAVHVPVHATLSGPQVAFQISDCSAQLVVLSSAEQAEKLSSCADQLPAGLKFFSFDSTVSPIGSADVAPLPKDLLTGEAVALDQWRAIKVEVTPETLATILYTSGTTGEPKGVMLNQRNLASNTRSTLEVVGQNDADLRLTFLPLSHIFARTADLYGWIDSGCMLALAESRETVLQDCAAVSPTLLNGVPYFYDKVHRYLVAQGLDKTPGALQQVLGGRMRFCCSGGAALADHVYDFFWEQNVPLVQGYGLTETSPVISVGTVEDSRRGTVGRPIPGVEVRVLEDGELITRGPNVMIGYYKNSAATREIIRDGWLYTGDYGSLEDGFVKISGRKKEIIVTTGGKNVAPVLLESLLTQDPLIMQVIVLGDQRNYLTALVVPEPELLQQELQPLGLVDEPLAAALAHPRVVELFEDRIKKQLESVSQYEQIQRFMLLERAFSIDLGELTPKLSLRRATIQENYQEQIEAMYVE